MAREHHTWGPHEEKMHPRDSGGEFRAKGGGIGKIAGKIESGLRASSLAPGEKIDPKTPVVGLRGMAKDRGVDLRGAKTKREIIERLEGKSGAPVKNTGAIEVRHAQERVANKKALLESERSMRINRGEKRRTAEEIQYADELKAAREHLRQARAGGERDTTPGGTSGEPKAPKAPKAPKKRAPQKKATPPARSAFHEGDDPLNEDDPTDYEAEWENGAEGRALQREQDQRREREQRRDWASDISDRISDHPDERELGGTGQLGAAAWLKMEAERGGVKAADNWADIKANEWVRTKNGKWIRVIRKRSHVGSDGRPSVSYDMAIPGGESTYSADAIERLVRDYSAAKYYSDRRRAAGAPA